MAKVYKNIVKTINSKDGKKSYHNLGVIMEREDGNMFVILNCFPEPVIASLYDPKPASGYSTAEKPSTTSSEIRIDDDIPWK